MWAPRSSTVTPVRIRPLFQPWPYTSNGYTINMPPTLVEAEEATRLPAVAAADTAGRLAVAGETTAVVEEAVVAGDTAAPAADIVAAEAATVVETLPPAPVAADHILRAPKAGDEPSRNS